MGLRFKDCSSDVLVLGGEGSVELVFLFEGLELAVTDVGRCVNELDVNLLVGEVSGRDEKSFSDGDDSLSGSLDCSLDQKEIVLDDTVVRESTHWGDVLLDAISFAIGVSSLASSDSVDLVAELSSVEVTELTRSGDSPRD